MTELGLGTGTIEFRESSLVERGKVWTVGGVLWIHPETRTIVERLWNESVRWSRLWRAFMKGRDFEGRALLRDWMQRKLSNTT